MALMLRPDCSVCGTQRNPDGVCPFDGCGDPLYENKREDRLMEQTRYLHTLEMLRKAGWMVAVHNDYRRQGRLHTFWLFTHPNGHWLKGEGYTDADALEQIRRMWEYRR